MGRQNYSTAGGRAQKRYREPSISRVPQDKADSQHAPRPGLHIPACKETPSPQQDYYSRHALLTAGQPPRRPGGGRLSSPQKCGVSLPSLSLESKDRTTPPSSQLQRLLFFGPFFIACFIRIAGEPMARAGGAVGGSAWPS